MSAEADEKVQEPVTDEEPERETKLRRRAGCLWGCLTEPLVILVLVLAALLTGRYLWGRRHARGKRRKGDEED